MSAEWSDGQLELWFSPVPINLEAGVLPGYFARCAREAERLRRAHRGRVVLVAGWEISLWCAGFLPGGDSVFGRIAALTDPDLQRKPDVMAALASGLERARHTLRDIVPAVREEFAGPLTYAAAPWETIDWELFDLVSVDAYRDADNAAGYRDALRACRGFGKPVAVKRASHHLPRWHHPHRGIRCECPIHAAGTTWLGHSRRINSRGGSRQAGSRATTATAITRQMPSPGRQAPANPGGPRKARNPRR